MRRGILQLHVRTVTAHQLRYVLLFFRTKVKEMYYFSLVQDASLSEEWVFPAAGRIAMQRSVAEGDHKCMWQKPAVEELNWDKSIRN